MFTISTECFTLKNRFSLFSPFVIIPILICCCINSMLIEYGRTDNEINNNDKILYQVIGGIFLFLTCMILIYKIIKIVGNIILKI